MAAGITPGEAGIIMDDADEVAIQAKETYYKIEDIWSGTEEPTIKKPQQFEVKWPAGEENEEVTIQPEKQGE